MAYFQTREAKASVTDFGIIWLPTDLAQYLGFGLIIPTLEHVIVGCVRSNNFEGVIAHKFELVEGDTPLESTGVEAESVGLGEVQDIGEPTESEVKEDMSRSAASIKGVRVSLPEKE